MDNRHLKIAVFIDFDNIEIGVKSTLQREFDVSVVLEALKERGEIITKIAYANWGKLENSTRQLSEYAVQMVQRDPSPRGDKNGADINLALDALELAFTHDHINAFCIVSGDSDFIALVNKLKQYDKTVFVVGGKAFTSTILQKNCHEFISYESMLDDSRPAQRPQHPQRELQKVTLAKDKVAAAASGEVLAAGVEAPAGAPVQQAPRQERQQGGGGGSQQNRRPVLDLHQAMPLVERALQVLERREVRPQLGLLKSTMLQLDSSFSERAYGAGSFTDFIERLRKSDMIHVTGGEGRYMIQRKLRSGAPEKTVKPEEALPYLRDVLENHRLELEDGVTSDELMGWVKEESPTFDWKSYGFQEFSEFLNYAQDKTVVRIEPNEATGLTVFLGAEFHPPAVPEPEPLPLPEETEEIEEPQPVVPGQPTAGSPRVRKGLKKMATGPDVNGNVVAPPKRGAEGVGNAAEAEDGYELGFRFRVRSASRARPWTELEASADRKDSCGALVNLDGPWVLAGAGGSACLNVVWRRVARRRRRVRVWQGQAGLAALTRTQSRFHKASSQRPGKHWDL